MMQATPLRRTLNVSKCTSCHQHGHVESKTLLQQYPAVLNWGCRLMQVVLYNGDKTVLVRVVSSSSRLVVVVVVVVHAK